MKSGNYDFKLFFRPGHYDIIVDQSESSEETHKSIRTNNEKVERGQIMHPNTKRYQTML